MFISVCISLLLFPILSIFLFLIILSPLSFSLPQPLLQSPPTPTTHSLAHSINFLYLIYPCSLMHLFIYLYCFVKLSLYFSLIWLYFVCLSIMYIDYLLSNAVNAIGKKRDFNKFTATLYLNNSLMRIVWWGQPRCRPT